MGERAGGSGVWVVIAFLLIGLWIHRSAERRQEQVMRALVERSDIADSPERSTEGAGELPIATATPATGASGRDIDVERPAVEPGRELQATDAATGSAVSAPPPSTRGDCVLSTGPFALPAGTQSVDWKIVNRSDYGVDIEVVVHRLRLDREAEIVAPGVLRKTLGPGATTHNANSVGAGKPFPPGSDFEIVVRHSAPGVLPSISFWSDHGNTEIPGTRIGPRDFVAVGGFCAHD
jgi:hypothetical protein